MGSCSCPFGILSSYNMMPYHSPLVPQFNGINQENDRKACHFLQVLTSLRSVPFGSPFGRTSGRPCSKKLIFSNIFLLFPFNGVQKKSGKSAFYNYSRVNNREKVPMRHKLENHSIKKVNMKVNPE